MGGRRGGLRHPTYPPDYRHPIAQRAGKPPDPLDNRFRDNRCITAKREPKANRPPQMLIPGRCHSDRGFLIRPWPMIGRTAYPPKRTPGVWRTRCCASRVVGQPPLCPADPTPQSEPLDERQVANSAGGYAYPVDDMTRLQRFLILGSEGGSYYADERKLTLENAAAVKRCIENDGTNAVYEIAYISRHGRAPKVGPPLFALAMAATYGHLGTRELAFGYLSQMARTGSQLQMFIDYIGTMRGWGRGLRRAVANWYLNKDIKDAVYQTVKYRQRYNWTHRDLLRKAHPKAASSEFNDLFAWITQGTMPPDNPNFALIHAYEQTKTADVQTLCNLIVRH